MSLEAMSLAIRNHAGRPFVWGQSDCVSMVADALQALHGCDHLAPYRGQWNDERSAVRVLARIGGLSAALEAIGKEVPTLTATTGDVAIINGIDGMQALGLIVDDCVLCKSECGVISLGFDRIQTAFKV